MRKSDTHLQFDTLAIEGGLFTAEWLGKVASFKAPAQGEADYRIRAGFTTREEIALSWRSARELWSLFDQARSRPGHDAFAVSRKFTLDLLEQAFGFRLSAAEWPQVVDGRHYPIGHFAFGDSVPVVTAAHDEAKGLDTPDVRCGDDSGERVRRRSAFGLLQEYLNAHDAALWGIAANGLTLRLARDNASLTRPAWVEVDLERLFVGENQAEFSVLWLLIHATRFGADGIGAHDCVLEQWRDACREQGTRARELLRLGVEQALLAFGQGFLAHPANTGLREALGQAPGDAGYLSGRDYFRQLLRLVYRLIFLLTVEERGLLHAPGGDPAAIELYETGYSLRRLRERAVRRSAHDRYHDLWEGLRRVWKGLAEGEPRLALPALSGLFAEHQCAALDGARLENRHLLAGLFHLAWLREESRGAAPLVRVNWRDMGPEELGSIYESLLELEPQLVDDNRRFEFLSGEATRGNARKTTGSFYTPDSLVQELLESALEPVIAERLAAHPSGEAAVRALLSISILDPACGSAHFLLAAARRLAVHLGRIRAEGNQPTPADYRQALRDVISHCIFGVDKNPMALELARASLWLEAFTPDAPLTFIDHHLVCGDALLGLMDFQPLKRGIPDKAFAPLSGDDRNLCKVLAADNRRGLKAFESLSSELPMSFRDRAEALALLDELPDDTPQALSEKERRYAELAAAARGGVLAQAADLYTAAFLMAKDQLADPALIPTSRTLYLHLHGNAPADPNLTSAARAVCEQARVLHWPLAFPQIFARGGFSVVLGNPPWEVSQLGEEEYFASRAPSIAALAGAKRKAAIASLPETNPSLWQEYVADKREYEATNTFLRESGRFSLTAVGKLNSYALFAEAIAQLIGVALVPQSAVQVAVDRGTSAGPNGRAGFIVPTGIAMDDSTKAFFQAISETGQLVSLYDFRTGPGLFSEIGHQRFKFCLLTLGITRCADFVFFALSAPDLEDRRRHFTLTSEDFARINPNTRTCPMFRSQRDAELTKAIYRRVPVLFEEEVLEGEVPLKPERNPWGIRFRQGLFNMTSDSHLFRDLPASDRLPLYEAKLIHQFDHRFASYTGSGEDGASDVTPQHKGNPDFAVRPRYWVDQREVWLRVSDVPPAFAKALADDDEERLIRALTIWLAGTALLHGDRKQAEAWLKPLVVTSGDRPATALRKLQESSEKARAIAETHRLSEAEYAEGIGLVGAPLPARSTVPGTGTGGRGGSTNPIDLGWAWLERRSPRWLMGWRDICRATDRRTLISSVLPLVGVGDKFLLLAPKHRSQTPAPLLANLNSLVCDYVARQKVGGTSFKYFTMKQIAVLQPSSYSATDLAFIVPRVLELTYTAHDLKPWAEDLGYDGPPFAFESDRRAVLRAELDAYYARLYGLTRDELRYILDPADVLGPDYPSETFRVLKNNEVREFGEYRTQRLVLAAWDALPEPGEGSR